jgi:FKBP-type peptidyl-prolyl cis-trans isomerase FkpA
MKKVLLLLSFVMTILSCKKEKSPEEQLAFDIEIIKKYIADNKLTALSTAEGVYYTIDVDGTGSTPTPSNLVTVKYKGYLTDGKAFDENTTGIEFRLSGLIAGWQIGLQKYKKGTKGKLLIPSAYGYGTSGQGSIPGNAVLVFDIELVSFK